MISSRRIFVRQLAIAAGSMMLWPSCSGLSRGEGSRNLRNIPGLKNFGLQLYTLRDDMPKDPMGVLNKVASYGYKQIESYEGPLGIYWNQGPAGFSAYVRELGMELVASHCDIHRDFEKKADEAALAGMKYLVCPFLGPQKTMDDYKRFAELFNQKGAVCKERGIKFAYHNHDYSFRKLEGQYPQEVMMNLTDSALVDFELDMYWVVAAGQDIGEWLGRHKNRFKLCHIKDYSKTPVANDSLNSVNLGTGTIAWEKVLRQAHEMGMEYYFVEQEAYPYSTPLEAVQSNGRYIKELTGSGE